MTFWQLWSTDTSNLIDAFDSEVAALAAVRWRFAVEGASATQTLALLRFDDPATPVTVACGDALLRRAQAGDPARAEALAHMLGNAHEVRTRRHGPHRRVAIA